MLHHAQGLVYSPLCLMPSVYQKASLKALLGRFLSEQGHALTEYTPLKSASSLSRFLNHYNQREFCERIRIVDRHRQQIYRSFDGG